MAAATNYTNRELVNTMNINPIIPKNTTNYSYPIDSRNYDFYEIVNVYANTSSSWYNVSSLIGNNSLTIQNYLTLTPQILNFTSNQINSYTANLNNISYTPNQQYLTSSPISVYNGTLIFTPPASYIVRVITYDISGNVNGNTEINLTVATGYTLPTGTLTMILTAYTSPLSNLTSIDKTLIQNAIGSFNLGSTQLTGTINFPNNYYTGIYSTENSIGIMALIQLINSSAIMMSLNGELLYNTESRLTLFQSNGQAYYVNFSGSTGLLFGFQNSSYLVYGCVESEEIINLDQSGRFANMRIQLLNLGSFGFIGESLTLITIPASALYGQAVLAERPMFRKFLPKCSVLNNLSFQITDNNGIPLLNNDPIQIDFQIQCYNYSKKI